MSKLHQIGVSLTQGQKQQEAISQREIVFRFRKDIQSLRKAGILIFCA